MKRILIVLCLLLLISCSSFNAQSKELVGFVVSINNELDEGTPFSEVKGNHPFYLVDSDTELRIEYEGFIEDFYRPTRNNTALVDLSLYLPKSDLSTKVNLYNIEKISNNHVVGENILSESLVFDKNPMTMLSMTLFNETIEIDISMRFILREADSDMRVVELNKDNVHINAYDLKGNIIELLDDID